MRQDHANAVLDLSVTSLPDPVSDRPVAVRTSRLKLLSIVFVCSLPALVAYLAYYVVRPQGEAAFGSLLVPVRALPDAQAVGLDGGPVALASLKAQWLLVKVDGGACIKDCQKQLMLLRQLRLTLGKDMDRIDWVWLIDDQAGVSPQLQHHLSTDHAVVLRVDAQVLQSWLAAPPGHDLKDYFYVVDPMGNAMMRFPVRMDSAAAAKARRDLEHLLRASLPWDPPGR